MKSTIADLNTLLDKLDKIYWDRLTPEDRVETNRPIAEIHGEIQDLFSQTFEDN